MEQQFNKFPLPFTYEGKLCDFFSPRELTLQEVKEINDPNYKTNHPIEWAMKVASYVIAEVGDVRPYEYYKQNGVFHPVISAIPMINSSVIALAGHVKTFGEFVEDITIKCPNCGKENKISVNLFQLKIEDIDSTYEDLLIDVEINEGFTIAKEYAEKIGMPEYDGEPFTKLQFRVPTIGNSLALEDEFGTSSESLFMEHLLGSCLVAASTASGHDLNDKAIKLKGQTFMSKLKARDMKAIISAHNKQVPENDIKFHKSCKKCSNELSVNVDTTFLLKLG